MSGVILSLAKLAELLRKLGDNELVSPGAHVDALILIPQPGVTRPWRPLPKLINFHISGHRPGAD